MVAEYVAILYYLIRGYRILAHRWKIHKFGEIDLIVCRFNTIAFVEVKSRRLVIAEEILQQSQLKRIGRVAELFFSKNPKYSTYNARIDFAIATNFIFLKVFQNAHHFEK